MYVSKKISNSPFTTNKIIDEYVESSLEKILESELIDTELGRRSCAQHISTTCMVQEKINTSNEPPINQPGVPNNPVLTGKVVNVEKTDIPMLINEIEPLSNQSLSAHKPLKLKSNIKLLEMHSSDKVEDVSKPSSNSNSSTKELNWNEIAEVFQSEAGFTIATDVKPILATYGCGPCVALCGYEETNKIAFIVHFSTVREILEYFKYIQNKIANIAKQKIENPIQLHLRGGIKGVSENRIEAIKEQIKFVKCFSMEIISEEVLGNGSNSKSIMIDSRTGLVSEYDPKENPKARQFGELEILSALNSAYSPDIRVSYTPKLD